jgi:hypothetical protein
MLFCLSVLCYYVSYVICMLCLIVVPLPPAKEPFAVKISNIYIYIYTYILNCIRMGSMADFYDQGS